jgi:hypothetical protein
VELQLDASGNSWTGLSGECDGLVEWPFNGLNGQTADASSEAEPVIIIGPNAKGGRGADF